MLQVDEFLGNVRLGFLSIEMVNCFPKMCPAQYVSIKHGCFQFTNLEAFASVLVVPVGASTMLSICLALRQHSKCCPFSLEKRGTGSLSAAFPMAFKPS